MSRSITHLTAITQGVRWPRPRPGLLLAFRVQQVVAHQDLVTLGANSHYRDPRARHCLECLDIRLGSLGKVLECAGLGYVLVPAVEEFVDRLGRRESGLLLWEFLEARAVDVIRDANRDLLPARQHVELGEDDVRQPIHAGGVAGDHRVVPTGAARTARRGAEL